MITGIMNRFLGTLKTGQAVRNQRHTLRASVPVISLKRMTIACETATDIGLFSLHDMDRVALGGHKGIVAL